MKPTKEIVEKKLGISPDYQYRALRQSLWAKKNWHRNKFAVVKMLSGFSKQDEVLDLGTGSGNFELLFSGAVKQIYGIDYNDEALLFLKNKLVSRKIKNVTLECCDMRKLSPTLASKKYDLIISVDTIEHISKNDGARVISWSSKRLKRDGKLVIITPNYQSVWFLLEPVLDKLSFTPDMGTHQHLSKYSVESMCNTLQRKGLKIKKIMTFNLFSFLFPKAVNDRLLKLETKFLGKRGPLMAIVAEKG